MGDAAAEPMEPSLANYPVKLRLGCVTCDGNGVLLLGGRPDGSLYGSDDLLALKSVLPALRHALEASLLIEEVRAQIRGIDRKCQHKQRVETAA